MKHPFTTLGAVLLLAVFTASGHVAAQSLSNGDLSKGAASWRGDRDVQDDPDKAASSNKVLAVEVKKSKSATFSQTVDAGSAKTLTFTFDVKGSEDYNGDGFQVKITRANGSFQWQNYAKIGPTWEKQELVFTNASRKIEFSIEVKAGKGKLFFDNFAVK